MNENTIRNNYFYFGQENVDSGRGQYGSGAKEGSVWGTKTVHSKSKEDTQVQGKISLYNYIDNIQKNKKGQFEVEIETDPNKLTYSDNELKEILLSDHGSIASTHIYHKEVKKQGWGSRGPIKENLIKIMHDFHTRHVLNEMSIVVTYLSLLKILIIINNNT